KDITAQIAYSKLGGDVILAAAYSHELPRYGVEGNFTNHSASYATGLLLACRLLKKLRGERGEEEEGAAPFRADLDTGLARTTKGSRIFSVMMGVVDGGIDVPHDESVDDQVEQTEDEMWTQAHAAIRASPEPLVKEKKEVEKKSWNEAKLTYSERQ
ncbi:hypothetical protein PMAYCL1PPCAC_03714, partial [Pristionchus mayeri]